MENVAFESISVWTARSIKPTGVKPNGVDLIGRRALAPV